MASQKDASAQNNMASHNNLTSQNNLAFQNNWDFQDTLASENNFTLQNILVTQNNMNSKNNWASLNDLPSQYSTPTYHLNHNTYGIQRNNPQMVLNYSPSNFHPTNEYIPNIGQSAKFFAQYPQYPSTAVGLLKRHDNKFIA